MRRRAYAIVAALVMGTVGARAARAQRPDSVARDTTQTVAVMRTTADAVAPGLVRVGFDERRRNSGLPAAHFVTRRDIDIQSPTLLREMLSRLGARARGCATGSVYVDGVLATENTNESDAAPRRTRGGTSSSSLVRSDQLDRIAPRDVEGMEIYTGSSQIPMIFRASGRAGSPPNCVIVVWTRER